MSRAHLVRPVAAPTIALVSIMAGAAAGSLHSQSVFSGRVRANSTRAAIPFAIVEVRDVGRSVQASISGIFMFDSIPTGIHTVIARAVGYLPTTVSVEVTANDTVEADLLLNQAATQLAPLEVVGKSAEPGGKMADFAARRRAGFGRFFDRDSFKRLGDGATLGGVLRRTGGVRLVPLPFPCRGNAAATGRGSATIQMPAAMVCSSYPPKPLAPACYLSIYVDGVRIWTWGQPDPPNVEDISLGGLEGAELYRGASELPTVFLTTGSSCGALLLWTRSGETR